MIINIKRKPCLWEKQRFSKKNCKKITNIAKARIYVERAIARIKEEIYGHNSRSYFAFTRLFLCKIPLLIYYCYRKIYTKSTFGKARQKQNLSNKFRLVKNMRKSKFVYTFFLTEMKLYEWLKHFVPKQMSKCMKHILSNMKLEMISYT